MFEEMRNRMKRLAGLLIAMAAVSLLIACGGDEPSKPAPAPPPPTATTTPTPSPAVKPPIPKSVMEQLEVEVEVPEYYPKDVPVYPGSKASKAAWHRGRVTAVFSTPDSVADVATYMNDFLGAQGWEDVQNMEIVDGTIVQGTKRASDRGISLLLTRVEEEGGSATLIVVATDP
jgi:hypothetical protein